MTPKQELSTEVREYGTEKIEVIYRKLRPAKESNGLYPERAPGTTVANGILFESDVRVPMRGGIILYTDIYRPEGESNIPAIVAWRTIGKIRLGLGCLFSTRVEQIK